LNKTTVIIDNANNTQYYNKPFIMDHGLIYMESSILSMEKENEALAHRFHMDIFQKGNLKIVDEIISPNFVMHNPMLPPEVKEGPEGVRKFAMATIDAIPDRQFIHQDAIANGDKILIRWKLAGKIIKEKFGIPPSDKPVIITDFDLFKIIDGEIVEMWQQFNFGNW
jgi:predicted SnoaL-like aldol condensation-catalyzing enzyme